MTGRMHRLRKLVYPLHTKGMLTLCLLFLAESVTFANARTLWSKTDRSFSDNSGTRTKSDPFSQQQQTNEEFNNNNIDGTCSPPPSTSSKKVRGPFGHFFSIVGDIGRSTTRSNNNFSMDDCCRDCYSCMDPRQAQDVCQTVPRGGHVVHHAAQRVVEAAAGAVAEGGAVVATPYGIPLNGWKVIFQAILTTINVLCWLIPLRSKKISENKLALSLANAFSGGVFLSLAFGHLIPECVHGFHNYNEVTPYMLVLSGYLLIFFVEKVAFDAHDILHEMEHGGGGGHGDNKNHPHSHGNGAVAAANQEKPVATTGRSALILLGALAVHSILEMAALGLADTFGDCALLTLSIALHQPAESIALLVAFLKSGMPKDQILLYLSIFSAMGPIGVALGMAVNEFAAPIVDSIMVAVVAGTFVYVGATEVIPEEWENSEHKWKKFAALMAGIISILAITQYTATLEL